jgi:hypothetical protein
VDERQIIADFFRALFDTTLAVVLFILDVIGLLAVAVWVIDDLSEALVVGVFLAVILVASYLLFRKSRMQVARYEDSSPRIVYFDTQQAQMYHDSPVVSGKTPTYQILQVWFENKPRIRGTSSVGRNVTARVTLSDEHGSRLFDYHGQWAKSNAPDNVGFDDILDETDIPPSGLKAKLIIALKYPIDDECYAFSREALRSTVDGRSERFAIAPGTYKLKIRLAGIGVDREFAFTLENRGSGSPLMLQSIDPQM